MNVRFRLLPVLLLVLGDASFREFNPGAYGAEEPAQTLKLPAPAHPERSVEEAKIREEATRFTAAFNAGDARALADLFTQDAEMIDENGDRVQGREHIQNLFEALFKDRPGAKLSVTVDSLRLLGPDAAKEEGRTKLNFPGSALPVARRYTVLYVKQDGGWRHSSVREEHDRTITPHDRLKELEWMIGEWIDESADSTVTANCRWSDDKNFLLRDFNILVQGKMAMRVSQRIGWDPLTRQIKSWVFDSEGGHGEGSWSRDGEGWIIKASAVLPDGRIASGTNIVARTSADSMKWISVDRTLAGEVIANHEAYLLVRKAPQPKAR